MTTYFMLCAENYLWHWRGYLGGGVVAVYLFVHGLVYLCTDLEGLSSGAAVFLYVTYLLIMSVIVGLFLSALSYLGSRWFVQRIFQAIKCD